MLTRRIGGESGGRSFFGGSTSKARTGALIVSGLAWGLLTLFFQFWGIVGGLLLVALAYAGTMQTHRGTWWDRVRRRRYWAELEERGMREFRPVQDRPADLDPTVGKRRERREKQREWNAYRDFPDAADGLYWLSSAPDEPGVAWQIPAGQDSYLSVVFAVSGAVRGLEPDLVVDNHARSFGRLIARMAPRLALAGRIQMITRVMPVDSARHEEWVVREYDPSTPQALLESYDEVVREVGRGGLAQRHYVAVRWPLSPVFLAEARRRGELQEGWRLLMRSQIDSMRRQLEAAGLGKVRPLTAAQCLAVMRSMQVPEWPLDEAGTLAETGAWFPSTAHWPYNAVEGVGPDGEPRRWLHRTAEVRAEDIETSDRSPLWLNGLLGRLPDRIIRTVSIQHEAVPAKIARDSARTDVTSDMAQILDARVKGEITPAEAQSRLDAARARLSVLGPGSGYQGDAWAMHVTISAPDTNLLSLATSRINEAAEQVGISRLTWLDAYQSTAQGYTWPLVRGMGEVEVGLGAKITDRMAGTGGKEELA